MLNLGDVNFGIDADVSPLLGAQDAIVKFGNTVTQAAKRTAEGSQQITDALRRQEAAAVSAFTTIANFQSNVFRKGGSQENIDQTTSALNNLVKVLTSGQNSPLQFQRGMEQFRLSLSAARRDLADFLDAERQMAKQSGDSTGFKTPFFSDSKSGSSSIIRMQRAIQDLNTQLNGVEQSEAKFFSTTQGGSSQILRMRDNVETLVNSLKELKAAELAASQAAASIQRANLQYDYMGQLSKGRTSGTYNQSVQSAINSSIPALGGGVKAEDILSPGTLKAIEDGEKAGRGFADAMRDIAQATALATGPLSGLAFRVTLLTDLFSKQNVVLAGSVVGIAAFAYGFFELAKGAVSTAQQLNVVQQRFDAIGGSSASTTDELSHLQQMSLRLGTDFLKTADAFSSFIVAAQGSGLTTKELTNIFDTFTAVGAKLHLPAEEMQRVMQVLQRMMSTGIINATELRRQLATALPGAYEQMALAMGMSEEQLSKLSKAGGLFANEALPKMADQMQKFYHVTGDHTTIDSLSASLGRLTTSGELLYIAFDHTFSISQAYKASLDGLSGTFQFLATNMDSMKAAAEAGAIAVALLFAPQIIAAIAAASAALLTAALSAASYFDALIAGEAVTATAMASLAGLARMLGIAAVAYLAYKALLGDGSAALDQNIAKQKEFVASLGHDTLASSDSIKHHIDDLHASIQATQDLIDKDKERIAQQAGGNAHSDNPFTAAIGGLQGLYSNVTSSTSDANSALDTHNEKLRELQGLLPQLEAAWNRVHDAESGKKGPNTDQQDAIIEANRRLANLQRLIDAAKGGKEAFKAMNDEINAENKAQSEDKSLIGKTGWDTTAIDAWNKKFISATVAVDKLKEGFANNKSMETFNNTIRDTAQNLALAQAAMSGGKGAYDALKKQFDDFNKADDARQRIEHLGKSTAEAKRVADAFVDSLKAETAALDKLEFEKITTDLQHLKDEFAAAGKNSQGMLMAMEEGYKREEFLKKIHDEVLKFTGDEQTAIQVSSSFATALNNIDGTKASKGLKDLDDQLAHVNAKIALIQGGKGQPALDSLDRHYASIKEVQSYMDTQEAANIIQARADELINNGADAAKAYSQATDELRAKIVNLAGANEQLANLSASLQDQKDMWKDFARSINSAADSVSQSLADMAVGIGDSNFNILQSFQKLTAGLLAEMIKMQLIKPVFDAILSPLTGTDDLSRRGGTNGLGGGGGFFGLLGNGGLGGLFGGGSGEASGGGDFLGTGGGGLLGSLGDIFGGGSESLAASGIPVDEGSSLISAVTDAAELFAKGGAWDHGVRYAADGMVLGGSTLFNTSGGPVIGGELGANSEALMPLHRDAQGRLGVKAAMSGGSGNSGGGGRPGITMIVNARDAPSFGYDEKQIGTQTYAAYQRAYKKNGG